MRRQPMDRGRRREDVAVAMPGAAGDVPLDIDKKDWREAGA